MSFCNGLNGKLRHAIASFDEFLEKHVDEVLNITTAVRNALKSPVGVLITDLIPGTWDDALRNLAIEGLSRAINTMSIVSKCEKCTSPQEKLDCYIAELKTYTNEKQDSDIFKVASIILGHIHGDQLPRRLYDLFVQTKVIADK
jgi:hypothetical protein